MCESHRYGGGNVALVAKEPPVEVLDEPKQPENKLISERESARLIRFLEEGNPAKIKAADVVQSIRSKIALVEPQNQTDEFALSHAASVVSGIENEDPLTEESIQAAVGIVQWLVEKGLE